MPGIDNVTPKNSREILKQFADASKNRGTFTRASRALVIQNGSIERRGSSFFSLGSRDKIVSENDNRTLRKALFDAITIEYGSDAAQKIRTSLLGKQEVVRPDNLGAEEVRAAFEKAKAASGGKKPLLESIQDPDKGANHVATWKAAQAFLKKTDLGVGLREWLDPLIQPDEEFVVSDALTIFARNDLFRNIMEVAIQHPELSEKDAFIRGAENYFINRPEQTRAEVETHFSAIRNALPPTETVLAASPISVALQAHPENPYKEKSLDLPETTLYRSGASERKILTEKLQQEINQKASIKGQFPIIEDFSKDERLVQFKTDLRRNGTVKVAENKVAGNGEALDDAKLPKAVHGHLANLYPEHTEKADAAMRDLAQVLHQGTIGLYMEKLSTKSEGGARPWTTPLHDSARNCSIQQEEGSESLIIEIKGNEPVGHIEYGAHSDPFILSLDQYRLTGQVDPQARATVRSNLNMKLRYTPPTDAAKPGRIEVLDIIEQLDASNLKPF